jgi:hypothetical protein
MRTTNYDRIFFEPALWLRISLVVAVHGTVKDMPLSRASTWSDARQGSTRSSSALHRHVDTVKDLRSYTRYIARHFSLFTPTAFRDRPPLRNKDSASRNTTFSPPFCRSQSTLLNDVTLKIRDRDGIDIKSRLPFHIPERIDSLNSVIGARMLVRNTRCVKTLKIAY